MRNPENVVQTKPATNLDWAHWAGVVKDRFGVPRPREPKIEEGSRKRGK